MDDELIILYGIILFAVAIISFTIINIVTKKIMINSYIKRTEKLFDSMFKDKEDELKLRIKNSVLNEVKTQIIKLQDKVIELMDKK